uniref:Rab-GAP TBC domain-containing protein n=1 Tax=Globisporangium ultimum (strain ATCC 200006 / CBS 805.95 / DAOM BR144) TaxID=431595 RepID=K3X5Q8_GLOUD
MDERPDWYAVSGAQTLKLASAVSYSEYVRRSANLSTPEFEDDKRQIELDVPRTGASICEHILCIPLPEYGDDNDDGDVPSELLAPHLPVLRNILLAYSVRNPRVGYVQGHADVVCFLIGNINERRDEEEVFWVYASIIERVFPEDFFARIPKLHGFQVDNRLFKELVLRKLIPHTPALAQVDLTLVTSLLSCKWWVSIWVGQLPVHVLREVWDVMLGHDDGAILHLLLGLQFFQAAIDSMMVHMATEDWDSSYLYKIILQESQAIRSINPHEVLRNGHTMYGLNDEAIEDMRSTLRLDPAIRRPELSDLVRLTRFTLLELEQLHEEFAFLRFHTKAYERIKLRGLRQEFVESLVSREFTTWPVDIYVRLFQLMNPDGYGNISFSSLVKVIS